MDPVYFTISLIGILLTAVTAVISTIIALSKHFQSKEMCGSYRDSQEDREKHLLETLHETKDLYKSLEKMLRLITLHLPISDEEKRKILNSNGRR